MNMKLSLGQNLTQKKLSSNLGIIDNCLFRLIYITLCAWWTLFLHLFVFEAIIWHNWTLNMQIKPNIRSCVQNWSHLFCIYLYKESSYYYNSTSFRVLGRCFIIWHIISFLGNKSFAFFSIRKVAINKIKLNSGS